MVKVILVLIGFCLVACNKIKQPNYLIITLEHFNSKTIHCSSEDLPNKKSGFSIVCSDFHKFTHAYTTSTLAVPAMSSLMTGLYPYSHNVRFNTKQSLLPEFVTFAEEAKKNFNYKTLFISAGPPFFRKTGLSQGFDQFEDSISSESLMRPVLKNIEILKNWINENANDPFLSIMHLSDLKYDFLETQNKLGETRNLSFDSQLEEVDEALAALFSFLKSKNHWDDTKIILLGLNGHNWDESYSDDFLPMSLKSFNIQVGFYFKDNIRKSFNSNVETINQAISVKDIGQLLINSFSKDSQNLISFKNWNLNSFLELKKTQSEFIVSESAWAKWQGYGQIRSSLVDNNQLFIFDQKRALYNKLTDTLEQYPQPINSANIDKQKIQEYENYLVGKNFLPFKFSKELEVFIQDKEKLQNKDKKFEPTDPKIDFFRYLFAIEEKNSTLINYYKNKFQLFESDECLVGYLKRTSLTEIKKSCKDLLFRSYYESIINPKFDKKNYSLSFQTEFNYFLIQKDYWKTNFKSDFDSIELKTLNPNKLRTFLLYQNSKSL